MPGMALYRSLTRPTVRPLELALAAQKKIGTRALITSALGQNALCIQITRIECISIPGQSRKR